MNEQIANVKFCQWRMRITTKAVHDMQGDIELRYAELVAGDKIKLNLKL